MSALPMEAAARQATHDSDKRPARPRETNPGILEAIGFTGDGLDRVEHALADGLPAAIERLEDRLRPLTRQTPPRAMGADGAGAAGPASDESSVAAQQVASLGHRVYGALARIEELAARLDELAGNVDLA